MDDWQFAVWHTGRVIVRTSQEGMHKTENARRIAWGLSLEKPINFVWPLDASHCVARHGWD